MASRTARAVGIDIGVDAAWLVALDSGSDRPRVVDALLSHPIDLVRIEKFCHESSVAIDAPGGLSIQPHLLDARIAPKFRPGRCSEVALSLAGISVQFVTPALDDAVTSWMRSGFAVWRTLEESGLRPLETYPHGVFWRLAGRPLFHKQRPAGATARLEVLGPHVELTTDVEMWSHDGLDALAAALVAWLALSGDAERIDCRSDDAWPVHDGSAMFLPKVGQARPPGSTTASGQVAR